MNIYILFLNMKYNDKMECSLIEILLKGPDREVILCRSYVNNTWNEEEAM